MSVVPKNNGDKVTWYEAHDAPWTANAVAMGSTTVVVADVKAKTTAARAALTAQAAAQEVAKAATITVNEAIRALDLAGTTVIEQVRTKGKTAGDGVYAMAQLPVPSIPKPAPAPGTATDFKAMLNPNGSLGMTWKCANSGTQGVMYMVYRKTGPTGDFISLGGTGERKFTDATIPAGTAQVTYSIQAIRSTAAGQFAEFVVNFGAGGLISPQAVKVKLAA